MNLTKLESSIVGGLLATVSFLQLEANLSHELHVILAAVAVFVGTVFVNPTGEKATTKETGPTGE